METAQYERNAQARAVLEMTPRVTNRWVYLLPVLHLCASLTMPLGYYIRRLDFLGTVWTYLMLIDLPISLVTFALAWKHSVLAATWLVVVGTLWWYLLSRGVFLVFRKFTGRKPAPQDLIPKSNVSDSARRRA